MFLADLIPTLQSTPVTDKVVRRTLRRAVILVILATTGYLVAGHPQCVQQPFPLAPPENSWCSAETYSATNPPSSCCSASDLDSLESRFHVDLSEDNVEDYPECARLHRTVLCLRCNPFEAHMFGGEYNSSQTAPNLCAAFCERYLSACGVVLNLPPTYCERDQTIIYDPYDAYYCYPFRPQQQLGPGSMVPAFPDLPKLRAMVDIRAYAGRLYVVQQHGKVVSFEERANASQVTIFLDIEDRTDGVSEMGLYSIAFHPDFHSESGGYIYVHYSQIVDGAARSVISRFTAESALAADSSSEFVLLLVEQPFTYHKGGFLDWFPTEHSHSGRLIVSFGDGGGANDPNYSAQDPNKLLGKLVSLDPESGDAIIYASGFRNPWRCSLDSNGTHALWCGDVGQRRWEEVNIVEEGKNYGWSAFEGFECFKADKCEEVRLVATNPLFAYPHAARRNRVYGNAIVGGRVYRGLRAPNVYGMYVFADYETGGLFALAPRNRTRADEDGPFATKWDARYLLTGASISAIGQGADQEMYFVAYDTNEGDRIYQFPEEFVLPLLTERQDRSSAGLAVALTGVVVVSLLFVAAGVRLFRGWRRDKHVHGHNQLQSSDSTASMDVSVASH